MKRFVLIALTLTCFSVAHATSTIDESAEEWVSLYHGREASFQLSLNQKIPDICDSYGIPYRLTDDRQILVPARSRPNIVKLISGHYKK